MISIVEITNPPLGTGYQVSRGISVYVTDSNGIIVEPQEYYIVESPAANPPAWYVEEPVESQPTEVYVPQEVTMRQARLALHSAGLLNSIDSAIDAMQEPQKTLVKIEWEYSAKVERNSLLVQQMAAALGLTNEQLDQLFIQANSY